MSPKVLRRCDVCGKFHASYLVPDFQGRPARLCYDCWKGLYAAPQREEAEARKPDHDEPVEPDHGEPAKPVQSQ
jgi:hypothetical protein